jgi:IS5 family transposase
LADIDALFDDERFFDPFRPFFDPAIGRRSIPMETYLRMMFLEYRYRLGFEPLCREVSDSIAWRRFCRVPLDQAAPHPTTLMRITSRCGERAVAGLNDALLAKAAENKLIKTDKVRADTTVVEADVVYPTDSGLLAKGVARLAHLAAQLKAAGLATRTGARDRTRSVRRRAMPSGRGFRRAATMPRTRPRPSPGRWPPSPPWPSPMPATSPSTPAGACAARRCRPPAEQPPWSPSSSARRSWWSGSWPRPGYVSAEGCPTARSGW